VRRAYHSNDNFALGVMLFVVLLLMAVCESILYTSGVNNKKGDAVYVTASNIFKSCFKEPFERIVFVMKDGNAITYTTQDESHVRLSYGWFRQNLKRRGYAISDIIYCIHNHLKNPFFSQADRSLCGYMRHDGFEGVFAIYHQPTKRIIIYKENGRRK